MRAALVHIDGDPEDRLIGQMHALVASPVYVLATDPDIDTAGLIVAERVRRMVCRGGRRLRECEWGREDSEVMATVADTLAERYRRLLK